MSYVRSFTHLEDRPYADRALAMLKRVAFLVQPIMQARGWVLPLLSEFFPPQNNLVGINVNRGEKICLRLRPHDSPNTFLPEEAVIGTMLHELTHNVHANHDAKFYKFLRQLEDEYYVSQVKNFTQQRMEWNHDQVVGRGFRDESVGGLAYRDVVFEREAQQAIEKSLLNVGFECEIQRAIEKSLLSVGVEHEIQWAIEKSLLNTPNIDVPPCALSIPKSLWNMKGGVYGRWECGICTLINNPGSNQCNACGVYK